MTGGPSRAPDLPDSESSGDQRILGKNEQGRLVRSPSSPPTSTPASRRDVERLTVAVSGLSREVRAATSLLMNTQRNNPTTTSSTIGSHANPALDYQDTDEADDESDETLAKLAKPRQPRSLQQKQLAVSSLTGVGECRVLWDYRRTSLPTSSRC